MDEENCKDGVPVCNCGGTIKPDVVLYEEALDDACVNGAVRAISEADTLIIGGTSLVVYPAAGLINYFHGNHLVLINKDATAYDNRADLVINDSIGKVMAWE
jgi:NAD-dependent deacetylase